MRCTCDYPILPGRRAVALGSVAQVVARSSGAHPSAAGAVPVTTVFQRLPTPVECVWCGFPGQISWTEFICVMWHEDELHCGQIYSGPPVVRERWKPVGGRR